MVLRLDEIWMTTHFSGWKAICHCFSQSSSAARSCCRSSVSFLLKMGLYNRQSSAKRRWKLRKAADRERFPVVLLITLLLLMKYGHRWGLVAVYCWGSLWSIVGFVHAFRSTVVCGEASGELVSNAFEKSSRIISTWPPSARVLVSIVFTTIQ
jgi:hypothetical protein